MPLSFNTDIITFLSVIKSFGDAKFFFLDARSNGQFVVHLQTLMSEGDSVYPRWTLICNNAKDEFQNKFISVNPRENHQIVSNRAFNDRHGTSSFSPV